MCSSFNIKNTPLALADAIPQQLAREVNDAAPIRVVDRKAGITGRDTAVQGPALLARNPVCVYMHAWVDVYMYVDR